MLSSNISWCLSSLDIEKICKIKLTKQEVLSTNIEQVTYLDLLNNYDIYEIVNNKKKISEQEISKVQRYLRRCLRFLLNHLLKLEKLFKIYMKGKLLKIHYNYGTNS